MQKKACKRLPNTATKKELQEAHRRKMLLKAAERMQPARSHKLHRVAANLSKRHKDHGKHPTEAN
jgi:hypothetical protein